METSIEIAIFFHRPLPSHEKPVFLRVAIEALFSFKVIASIRGTAIFLKQNSITLRNAFVMMPLSQ